VHKAVATSPIQESLLEGRKPLHVRFTGLSDDKNSNNNGLNLSSESNLLTVPRRSGVIVSSGGVLAPGSIIELTTCSDPQTDSSESETENNHSYLEEQITEKFLLLIDHLSYDQKRHLSIKDIGTILERLSSKIVDVERLDRETEATHCFNWTIKASIRGEQLQELGVIYNGNFYAISEHPAYAQIQVLPPPPLDHDNIEGSVAGGSVPPSGSIPGGQQMPGGSSVLPGGQPGQSISHPVTTTTSVTTVATDSAHEMEDMRL